MKIFLLIFILILSRFANAGTAEESNASHFGYALYNNGNDKFLYKVELRTRSMGDKGAIINVVWLEGPLKDHNSDMESERVYESEISYAGIKAGDEIYLHSLAKAKILGITNFNLIAIEIETGNEIGKRYPEYKREDLAVTQGCSTNWCVGQTQLLEINIKDTSIYFQSFKLVGLQPNGKFIVMGPDEKTGYYDVDSSIAVNTEGCSSKNICVGKSYYLISEKAFVKVINFTNDGQTNDQFLTGPRAGSNALFTSEQVSLEKSCQGEYCVGEAYYGAWKNSGRQVLLGFASNGSVLLAPFETPTKDEIFEKIEWLRKNQQNCTNEGDVCIEERVYNDDVGYAQVVGIQANDRLILKKENEENYVYNVDRLALEKLSGCDSEKKICVGHDYYVGTEFIKRKALSMRVDGSFIFGEGRQRKLYQKNEINMSGCAKALCKESDFR